MGVWGIGMGSIWKDPEAGGQELYLHLVQYSWDQSFTLGSSQQEHGQSGLTAAFTFILFFF